MGVISPTNPSLPGSIGVIPDATTANFAIYVSEYWGQDMPSGAPWTIALVSEITGISVSAITLFANWCAGFPSGTTAAQLIAGTSIVQTPFCTEIQAAASAPAPASIGSDDYFSNNRRSALFIFTWKEFNVFSLENDQIKRLEFNDKKIHAEKFCLGAVFYLWKGNSRRSHFNAWASGFGASNRVVEIRIFSKNIVGSFRKSLPIWTKSWKAFPG